MTTEVWAAFTEGTTFYYNKRIKVRFSHAGNWNTWWLRLCFTCLLLLCFRCPNKCYQTNIWSKGLKTNLNLRHLNDIELHVKIFNDNVVSFHQDQVTYTMQNVSYVLLILFPDETITLEYSIQIRPRHTNGRAAPFRRKNNLYYLFDIEYEGYLDSWFGLRLINPIQRKRAFVLAHVSV